LEFIRKDKELQIIDYNMNINCTYDGEMLKGTGSRKYRNEIMQEIDKNYKEKDIFTDKHRQDCIALAEVVSTWGSSNRTTNNVKVADLYKWLTNPVAYNKQLRNLALYWYGEKGLVTETLELYKTLPNLNSTLQCTDIEDKNYDKLNSQIKNLNYDLSKKSVIRDIVFHTALEGTCIGYINNKKYIQMLDLDYYYPARMKNGRWEVDVDLSKFISNKNQNSTLAWKKSNNSIGYIENQPLEVRNAWNRYNNIDKSQKGNKLTHIYTLNMENTFVIKVRCKQNERWGRPVAMGAFTAILHKELLQEAEKAVIDRVINTLLIGRYGEEGKDGYHPTPEQAKLVHNQVKSVLNEKTKDGIKLIGIPYWAEIKDLEVSLDIFDPKKYEEIDNDIAIGLGTSSIITTGESTYASGKINLEMLYSHIFEIIEKIEEEVFDYQFSLITKDGDCKFNKIFSRAVLLDIKDKITAINKMVEKGGSIKYLTDELGILFDEYVKQTKYEQQTLDLHSIFVPYANSSQTSGEEIGNPGKGGENYDGKNDLPDAGV
jgi:hypothetical protein